MNILVPPVVGPIGSGGTSLIGGWSIDPHEFLFFKNYLYFLEENPMKLVIDPFKIFIL